MASEDSYLDLDPSVIKEKRQSGDSLTDRYGVNAFSDEFRDLIADYKKRREDSSMEPDVFVKTMGQREEADITEYLFQNPSFAVSVESGQAQADETSVILISVWVLAMFGFALFMHKYRRYRKNRRSHQEILVVEERTAKKEQEGQ